MAAGGTLARRARAGRAPGMFCDPCPTGGMLLLSNIIWICPLAPGTSADVLIWDGSGPSRTRGDFFDFEVGGHDGAYKGGALSALREQCNYLGVWPY